MGKLDMMDVWIPLYHPSSIQKAPSASGEESSEQQQQQPAADSGKVHLLISYTPNGMAPKRDDIVAFESFARRPLGSSSGGQSENMGPIINPIIPPLSPLLVIDTHGQYLLLEYMTSRTVTSVDRNGNVKSSRWERCHRTRIHRNAIFVIERRTLMDAAGNLARLPGDIVLSTPIGQEIAHASAPIVAAAGELMGPALLSMRLMWATGGTGVKVALAGARAATDAVVTASQEKALSNRGVGERTEEAGGYSSYGG